MKKVLSLILALVMCLALCACGGNDSISDENDYYEYEAETETEDTFTASDAINKVSDSITGGLLYFRLKPYSADKIDNISIATITHENIDNGWIIECKGTFTAYDEYGDVMDRYKFDVTQTVYSDGTTNYADVNVTKKY